MVGGIIAEFFGQFIAEWLFHGTGRHLIYLVTLGRVDIPGYWKSGHTLGWSDLAAFVVGTLFWFGLIIIAIILFR